MNINEYDWHDKVVLNININRKNPGIIDEISFDIDDDDILKKLIFSEVYWINMNLNFGIIADECILSMQRLDENDKDLSLLYEKWRGSLTGKKLYSYLIELNSSGGIIKIISGKVVYQDLNSLL